MDADTFLLSLAAAFVGVAAGVLSAHLIARTSGVIPTTPRAVPREAAPPLRPPAPPAGQPPPNPPPPPSDGSLVVVVGLLLLVLLGSGRKGTSGKGP